VRALPYVFTLAEQETHMGLIRAIRGAIHRRKTDRQLIVAFQFEGDSLDTIYHSTMAIADLGRRQGIPTDRVFVKRTSRGVLPANITASLKKKLSTLTDRSRVYLDGHGNWQTQCLGGWKWKQVADLLGECGMPAVREVSILGCQLGRDLGTSDDERVSHSVNCFASRFHHRLREKWSIETVVHARIFITSTFDSGHAPHRWNVGQNITFNEDGDYDGAASARRRPHSKRVFYWEQGVQKVEWAY
jgi:hypothetical protein